MAKAYLDYYEENSIIPVAQSLTLEHFKRREKLLLSLGIPLKFLNKKRIIEFCPGTGDNAVVTSHGKPLRYTLVDGNTASVTAIQDRIKKGVLIKM